MTASGGRVVRLSEAVPLSPPFSWAAARGMGVPDPSRQQAPGFSSAARSPRTNGAGGDPVVKGPSPAAPNDGVGSFRASSASLTPANMWRALLPGSVITGRAFADGEKVS